MIDYLVLAVLLAAGGIVIGKSIARYWRAKNFRLWSRKRRYYLLANLWWGTGLVLLSISIHFGSLRPIAYFVAAWGFLLMVPAPCDMPIVNRSTPLRILRSVCFSFAAVLLFFLLYLQSTLST